MEKSVETRLENSTSGYAKYNPFVWIRRLYHWVLSWAGHPHSEKVLAFLAFIESIFFPIPADVLFIAMGAAQPKKSLRFATIMTVCSVLGGALGYAIGWAFWGVAQDFFFAYVFSQELFLKVQLEFQNNAFLAVFTAGFTPIPYKVFTIAGGVAEISFWTFMLASLFSRGLRFFIIGGLLFSFGAKIREAVEKYFEILTVVFTVLLIGGIYLIKFVL